MQHRRASVARLGARLMVRGGPLARRAATVTDTPPSALHRKADAPAAPHTARDCVWHRGAHAWAAGGAHAQAQPPVGSALRGSIAAQLVHQGTLPVRPHHPASARCFAAGPGAAAQQQQAGGSGGARSRAAALAAASRQTASGKGVPTAAYLAALTVAMVGATYGSVPLYRLFCQATGASC